MSLKDASLKEEKAQARKAALARRRAAFARAGARAGEAVAGRFLAAIEPPAGAPVSGYWPFGEELDPRPLMTALAGRSHAIGLPVISGRDRPLVFRRWRPGDPLEEGAYGILAPREDAPLLVPELLLVPLLAFDRRGYRLGYGGGYYDRTLAALRAQGPVLAVGLAFAQQEVDAVPHGAQDQRLDWIVTEREAITFEAP